MKFKTIKTLAVLPVIASILFASCYEGVLEYENTGSVNTDGGYSDSLETRDLCVKFLREGQQRVIDARMHKYQYQFSLHIDDYAGYMSVPHNFEGRQASSFAFNDDFSSGAMANLQWTAQQTIPVMNSAKKLSVAPLGAFASILFSCSVQQFTDVHGPVPLSDFKALKESGALTYQKQSEVYTELLHSLDSVVTVLEEYQREPDSEVDKLIVQADLVTQGGSAQDIVSRWIKFGNSLRLRIAMNVVKVDGYMVDGRTAQQIAEDAVSRGVLTASDPTIGMLCGSGTLVGVHPLFSISRSWVDSRLNASYENILGRTQHPFRDFLFNKNHGILKNVRNKIALNKDEKVIGIRSGVYLRDKSKDQDYLLFSCLSDNFQGEPLALIKVEEVLFLQAEGALRNWNMGGTAESFYTEGIRQSFVRHGLDYALSDYLAFPGMGDESNADKLEEYAYKDYYEPDNDLPKWDGYFMLNNGWGSKDTNPYTSVGGADELEQKLEKVITQKWIANFPMSLVAWNDYRRTGYPKILPACDYAYGDADGSIKEPVIDRVTGQTKSEGLYIRRMPYNRAGDLEKIQGVEATAIDALDAETTGSVKGDYQGTRLWWDIEGKSNF